MTAQPGRPASRYFVGALILLSSILVQTACAAGSAPTASTGSAAGSTGEVGKPKTLTIGIQREPPTFNSSLVQGGSTSGGANQVWDITNDTLIVEANKDAGLYEPRLATAMISLDDGTWQVNPDGTMDTTWTLRPNMRWQDGASFTSDDLVSSFQVYKDPAIPNAVGALLVAMASVSAPDPLTITVHWSSIYVRAAEAPGLVPIPRHLLGSTYETDKANFANSPFFADQFVGLGPYRLTRWDHDVQMVFSRFDDYYRGRPPFDTVTVRLFGNVNAMVSNILAGSIDVILPTGLDLDTALNLKQRWAGTGNQVYTGLSGGVRHLEIQFRPEYALPHNGLTNRSVRQALYSAIDRDALNQAVNQGVAPVADSWVPPTHALRPELEDAIPQFPYDPNRAQQLLADAGWTRGPDGMLVSAATGEPFTIEINGSEGTRTVREEPIIADNWKAVGVNATQATIPPSLGSDRQYRATLSGVNLSGGVGFEDFTTDRLYSQYAPSAATNWNGTNRGAYNNPSVDALLDQLNVTVAPDERLELNRELLQAQMGNVALMPLYWQVELVPALAGITGLDVSTWDFGGRDRNPA